MKHIVRVAFLAAFAMAVAACGGGSEGFGLTTSSSPPSTAPPVTATTVAPSSTTTVAASSTTVADTSSSSTTVVATGGLRGVENIRPAVVQIVGTGTFEDPIEGVQANVPGSGTGFIIAESGLAVTNNHVVTGAALLEVYLPGEDRARNARVLGVSECSDLAVIDISGDGYDYLDWYDGEVVSGLSIFAAGYPLGNPEYTLLDGIVSKERADGETTWASVDYTIEHSADTLPGNSGGPIVTADGAVVAVNYAGNQLGQSFAIAREEALPVIDLLIAGSDVDSIGVNGEAFEGIFPGIWVYSVESGSPADVAGVQAGDLITRIEGLDLALDGTMAVYCDILRSHDATDVLAVEVYRYASDEILAGQLNGDELAPVFSFTDEIVDEVPIDEGAVAATAYDEYTDITDDSGLLVMRVPVEWDDLNGAPWVTADDVDLGAALSASPDLDGFLGGWDTAGVFVGATSQVTQTITDALDEADFGGACIFADRLDYDDGLYQGMFDVWTDCGDAGSTFLVVVAEPPDGSFQVLVQIAIIEDRDWDAADKIISTFEVVGTP